MKTKVVVVIPNWNGQDYIADCLRSLEMQTLNPKIVVVDNGSADDSVQIIKDGFSKVKLLLQKTNLGFAGGVNKGIDWAIKNDYEYVALFNNDAVASKDWLKNLVTAGDNHKEAGIITGKFMRMDKKHIDSTGDFYTVWGMPFPRGRNQLDKGQYDTGEYIFGATGGASLYRITMLKEIGLFDEKFFAYYEDVDISFRAQLAGWKVWYEPSAVAYHHVSATSAKLGGFSHFHTTKNFYFLYTKNMPLGLFIKHFPSFIYQAIRNAASSIIHRNIISFCRGLLCVLYYTPSVLKDRFSIQNNTKLSRADIDNLLYHSKPPISPDI